MSRILVILRWFFIGFGAVLLAWGAGILYLGDQPALAAPIQAAADLQSLLGDQYDPYLLSADQTDIPAEATPVATDPSGGVSAAAEAAVQVARPERLMIPIINLDAPVIEATSKKYRIRDVLYEQWIVPDKFAVGWSPNAGYPGQNGNVVLFGHHNVNGAVFANLYKLQAGDQINVIDAKGQSFDYTVETVLKLKERGVSFDQMVQNSKWIQQTQDQRLTLVTCWPPYQSTYRLIVMARPTQADKSNSGIIP